jgi:propanediol utilization protein
MQIPVVVQHRHVHLSQADRGKLFGEEILAPVRAINQKGQSVLEKTIQVVGPNGRFEHVSLLGPDRAETQVELSASDAFALGIKTSTRISGDIARSGSCKLIGPAGELISKSSVIIPVRHLHCSPQTAEQLELSHHDIITLAINEVKNAEIEQVVVRIHPTYSLEFHLTKDEAAEYWIHSGDSATII